MSEKQRLISDLGDDIAEEHESNGSDDSPIVDGQNSLTRKLRKRPSPPHNTNSNYGTISDIKYQPLVGPDSGAITSKSHFTRKQTLIAIIAFLLFSVGVAVTLVLGLPRLEAKRREYFEAKFYESPLESVFYANKAILLNSAPECSDLAMNQPTVIDSAISSILCSLITAPHLIRPDSRIYGLYVRNGTYHQISTNFESIQITDRKIASPTIFQILHKIHHNFHAQKNFSDILQNTAKLSMNGFPMTGSLAEIINQNLESKYKWKNDFLNVKTSLDGTVQPGQIVKNPSLAQFLLNLNQTNIQQLLENELSSNFGETINMTEPEVHFTTPLETEFFNFTVLSPNNGAGFMMNRFLRIQEALNDKFDECNNQQRTLKDGTKEFHYLIETLKHSLEAFSSNQTDSEQNIYDRSSKIYSIQENNLSPKSVKKYGYSGDTLDLLKSIRKQSEKRSFQLLIHDATTGDSMVLVAQNRRNLFENNKFASKSLGFILDIFDDKDDKDVVDANPQANPMIVLDSQTKTLKYMLSSEYESSSAVAQVITKLVLGCETIKKSIDESRIFFLPNKNKILIEDKFPRAYIDLLMRLYGHLNVEITSKSEELSSVFAMQTRLHDETTNFSINYKKLELFFDWRSRGEGYLNGQ